MNPVPWRHISSWNCRACGQCCRGYDVILKYPEWVKIIQTYGIGVTRPGIDRLYLGKRPDGSCIFLYKSFDRWLCALQDIKPKACKLWPFKIYSQPRYGRPEQASYEYMDREFFVYLDPHCKGLKFGRNPSNQLASKTIPEFMEIAWGLRDRQQYSTSRIPSYHNELRLKARKII